MLSTTSSAPASCATLASASMSAMPAAGWWVSRPRPASSARPDRGGDRVDVGQRCRAVLDAPALLDLVEEPERAAVRVVGHHHVVAGVEQAARTIVSSAASPEANANPRSPSSSAAMLPSSAVRVGLAERLYS